MTRNSIIKTDPQRALAVTVPAVVRQELPAAVLAELETRVTGRGDFGFLSAGQPLPGYERTRPALWSFTFVGGVTYSAHTYGRREGQISMEGASLHGVVLDRDIALHESPLRVLEPGETVGALSVTKCPVSDLAVAPPPVGAGVNETDLSFVEVAGRVMEFCGGEHMLETLELKLTSAETVSGP